MSHTLSEKHMEAARAIAHQCSPLCTGGMKQGSDGVRYHSKGCDSMAALLATALANAEREGMKRAAEIARQQSEVIGASYGSSIDAALALASHAILSEAGEG